MKDRRRRGARRRLSTSRSPRHCRPVGIQFDCSEFPVSRGLFPAAGQGVRGCKAVNLSALIETTADEGNDRSLRRRQRLGGDGGRSRFLGGAIAGKPSLTPTFIFRLFLFSSPSLVLSGCSRIQSSAAMYTYIHQSGASDARLRVTAEIVTMRDTIVE